MEYYLQQEVIAGRIYTFPDNKYVSIWITDNPFSSGHGALAFAATRVEILKSRFKDAVNGRIPAPIE